jgi:protein involved in polysaccharide export with SLBB domain
MKSAICLLTVILCCSAFAAVAAAQGDGSRSAPAAYRIRQGDKLSVKFFTNPDLNEPSISVRPDGYISLQLINEIKAEGLTAAELKAALQKAYDEILLDPLISVAVIDFVSPHVFVAGQVGKPGRYDLREAQTVMQAVFLAGGFTRDANKSSVVVARPDGKGDWIIRSANVMKMLKRDGNEKDVELHDGDYVFVPESKLSQFNKIVESVRSVLPRFY